MKCFPVAPVCLRIYAALRRPDQSGPRPAGLGAPARDFGFGGDPAGKLPRNTDMMLDVTSQRKPDTDAPVPARPAPPGQRVVRHEGGVKMQVSSDPDWAALLIRVRDHEDRAAFALLFRHFAPRIKAFLRKSGATDALAEECAQDVMATVWHKAHLFDPSRASVATWIFTIARNRRIDALRKSRRPEPEDLPWGPEAEPEQSDALELRQETARLGAALAQLPEKQRALIERAYFGDLSHTEIAAETGLPLGTIKSRIRLALERLRHQMS
jgi:RNA polymerase sigma-70 factor (ECF subfamily)